MRELERRRAISGRVDARIAGAQVVIDMDSRDAIVLDVRGFESKAFYGRGAAGADDNFIDGDFRLRAARFDAQNLVAAAALDPQDRAAVGDRNAVASERASAASRSSRASTCGNASRSVTSAPRRRSACASSHPIGPPPIIAIRAGNSVMEKTVSLVR